KRGAAAVLGTGSRAPPPSGPRPGVRVGLPLDAPGGLVDLGRIEEFARLVGGPDLAPAQAAGRGEAADGRDPQEDGGAAANGRHVRTGHVQNQSDAVVQVNDDAEVLASDNR